MLLTLALAAAGAPPVPLDVALASFDRACVAPGPDVSAQRTAIAALKASVEPKQSTAPAALESYDAGAIGFMLIPGPQSSMCAVTAGVVIDVTPAQLTNAVATRYSIVPKLRRGTKTVQAGYWSMAGRTFNFELSDQKGLHVLLLSAYSKGYQ